jgi:hypothetical protein
MTWLTCIQELRGFIIDGANAIFANRQQHARAAKYWPLFIAQVCNGKESGDFRVRLPATSCVIFNFTNSQR